MQKIKIQDLKEKNCKINTLRNFDGKYYFDKSDYQIDLSNLPKIKKEWI
jgi:hypothetical protein